ncbi:2Fe-2S iron-sulfur cluster binding domain-containing protein [Azospirillum sp. RWY-5-1]|uniref:2Fe-2S iron-sulfur cluster binding domain-containing protein n=1 Tax=Azospirillum oleiclasticum TaxID=2735135 RepID=A0ABX2THF3_9PROT|nr:ferritin family protein [Azospirillum oleiclasticum]NYZ16196.1 2Fe-2S iron-sulfur cluster binding domain-containing protein [Azospirillum oleiclasticum]NYZ23683.1 2Fe-2S iron-sulfur cluster binding domain-containing protein [Azospirillum oleiclasticum]
MANVTFRSPSIAKDITLYAVAGDRGTILSLAKAHRIPIPFDCGDGNCGSCVIEVQTLTNKAPYGIALTEKEKEMLRQLGKITPQEVENAETNDTPPRFRLACQCFVRDEDILITFAGDETLPKAKPALSTAVKDYKGGLEIATVEEFLGYAVKVEEDAAIHFDELAAEMAKVGNTEVAELFSQLAGYSRLHLEEARKRAGDGVDSLVLPGDHVWPTLETPERTALWAGDPSLSRLDALRAALQGEKLGFEFYYTVQGHTKNPEIAALAKEFVKEEAEHVAILERWIERETANRKAAASA